MAEAPERLTAQRRRHIVIYAGRWQATPRWLFWKPKWRRRVLQYELGARPDAAYIWQYATRITIVNFGLEPEAAVSPPEMAEARSQTEAPREAAEAEPRTEVQPLATTEAGSLTEAQPLATAEAEPRTEVQPLATTEAEPRTEVQPLATTEAEPQAEAQPLETAEAEPQAEARPLATAEAESRTEAQPLEAIEAGSLTEAQPLATAEAEPRTEVQPLATTEAEPQAEAQPLETAEAAPRSEAQPQETIEEEPWTGAPPRETAEAEPQTEAHPLPEAIAAESQAQARPPRDPAAVGLWTKAPSPLETAEAESRLVGADEEGRPSDRPTSPQPGAAPVAGESDRAATSGKPEEEADEDAVAGTHKADEEGRRRRRPWVVLVGLLVIGLLVSGGAYYWWITRNLESTDDAYTDGRAITIAPQVAGEVVSLDINDNQLVKQGQALIHIDPRQYKNSRDQAEGALATAKAQHAGQQLAAEIAKKNFPALLEQAKAQLESAKASLAKTQADYDRQISLRLPATTQQEVDQAATALWQAEAQVKLAEAQVKQNSPVPQQIGQTEAQVRQLKGQIEQAQAQLAQAELNLSWTTVAAPQAGWITRRNVEKGNYVVAGQQILSIVTPEVWITANFKETQLTHMRPGQPVKIRIDAYPALDVRGHVDSIQRGSGSKFTAFPPENATGNFVKIVQRVPVKIIIDSGIPPDIPMPLGISVVPTVTVR